MSLAVAEDLKGVGDVRETSIGSDSVRPLLDLRALDFDGVAAHLANKVMVVPVCLGGGRPAQPVSGLTVWAVDDVEDAGVGEEFELPVHGCHTDTLTSPTQFVVHLVGAAESVVRR